MLRLCEINCDLAIISLLFEILSSFCLLFQRMLYQEIIVEERYQDRYVYYFVCSSL